MEGEEISDARSGACSFPLGISLFKWRGLLESSPVIAFGSSIVERDCALMARLLRMPTTTARRCRRHDVVLLQNAESTPLEDVTRNLKHGKAHKSEVSVDDAHMEEPEPLVTPSSLWVLLTPCTPLSSLVWPGLG